MAQKKKIVSFRCEDRLDAELRKLAKSLGVSISEAIEESIKMGAYAYAKKKRAEMKASDECITIINNSELPEDNAEV